MTDLRFQTLGNITYGGERVNKVLLNSLLALMCKHDLAYIIIMTLYPCGWNDVQNDAFVWAQTHIHIACLHASCSLS